MELQKSEHFPLVVPGIGKDETSSKNQRTQQLGSVIDKVNPANYRVEQVANLPFQFITAYDTRGISTALAGFIVKVNEGTDAVTTDHLSAELMLLVLGIRIALTLCNVASESIADKDRFEKETKRREKVRTRYEEMFEQVQNQLKEGVEPNWSSYNAQIFSDVIDFYAQNNRVLTDQEEHLFYSVLRLAVPAERKRDVFNKLREFRKRNDEITRDALKETVTEALKHRIKPNPIIKNKVLRSALRILKRIGDFILANATGLALVTIVASYIAIIPFITVFMFPVYIAAIAVGVVFALLKVVRDVTERRHEKIASKFTEEKGRYRQSQAMKKLLSHSAQFAQEHQSSVNHSERDNLALNVGHGSAVRDQPRQPINNGDQKKPWSTGGSLTLRLFFMFPMTVAVSSVSGWWAVLTVSGVVAGLGGPALVGAALMIAPIVSAVVVALFALVKSFVNLYRDYHLEQEDIKEINSEWSIQEEQKKSNKTLREVSKLSEAELLENYIKEYLEQVNPNDRMANSKEFFHNIQKLIGAKISDAKSPNAWFGYLASKILIVKGDNWHATTRVLMLVSKLKAHKENKDHLYVGMDQKILLTPKFEQKSKSASSKFKSGFDTFCALIVPVILGLGVAVAFASGPAFPFVAIGVVCLLGITSFISVQIKKGYEDRKQEREILRARMTICDETTQFFMRSRHEVPVHKETVNPRPPAPKKSPASVLKFSRAGQQAFFSASPPTLRVSLAVSVQSTPEPIANDNNTDFKQSELHTEDCTVNADSRDDNTCTIL